MDILELLTKAIQLRKPISFEYDVENKVKGIRHGHPYAVFIHPTTDNVIVHIYQTHGVSDTKEKLPGWRSPLISHISSITIFNEHDCFIVEEHYKPNSSMYTRIICKV